MEDSVSLSKEQAGGVCLLRGPPPSDLSAHCTVRSTWLRARPEGSAGAQGPGPAWPRAPPCTERPSVHCDTPAISTHTVDALEPGLGRGMDIRRGGLRLEANRVKPMIEQK